MLGINEAARILGFQTVSARFLRNFSIKTRIFSQNITNLFIASKKKSVDLFIGNK